MEDLTAFQRDTLWLVLDMDHPKGIAIKEALGDLYGKEVLHGRLYPNLDDLAERGLLEKGKQDDRTNYYRVTSAGADVLNRRHEWEREKIAGSE